MAYRLAADALVAVHLGFILFVVCGGFLAWRWHHLAWVHLPAATWGALIEFAGWLCPLTTFENRWRTLAGQAGYEGGFVEHYVIPLVYPTGLTRGTQYLLGVVVLLLNLLAYTIYFRRRCRKARSHDNPTPTSRWVNDL
jgi:hypothetical protein